MIFCNQVVKEIFMKKQWCRIFCVVMSIMLILGLEIGADDEIGGSSSVEDIEFTTVSYDANGGSGSIPSDIFDMFDFYEYGEIIITLPDASAFTNPGHQFLGWSTRSDAVTAEYPANASYTVTTDITFYAVWQKVEFYGDMNGDGKITPEDSDIINRYFAGHPVKINEKWSDLNGDNIISRADAMILSRHLNEWEGYAALPYQVN